MKKNRKSKGTKKNPSKVGKTSTENEKTHSIKGKKSASNNESTHTSSNTEEADKVAKVPSCPESCPTKCFVEKETTCPSCEDLTVWKRKCKNLGVDLLEQEQQTCMDKLRFERDYYRRELERILECFENTATSTGSENAKNCTACQKKDQAIQYLQKENDYLSKEKHCLMTRLEGRSKLDMDSPGGKCGKALCKRMERERDLLKLDVHRLEEETDCLRDRIKIINENKTREYARFQEQRAENEIIIRRLENEKRELVKAQGVRRITINALEEKVETYTSLLKSTQEEMNRIKTQYWQLKKLHEQCDTALLDTQAQLMEVETELLHFRKNTDTWKNRETSSQYSKYTNDAITEPAQYAKNERSTSNQYKYGLERGLNTSKEVFRKQSNSENNHEILESQEIEKLKVEIKNLEEKVKNSSKEAKEMKEQYNKSSMLLQERSREIKRLQEENETIQLDKKKYKTNLEEKEVQNTALQAEVEKLKKEVYALKNSNINLQTDSDHAKIQVSVAMESVNELENKMRKLEGINQKHVNQLQAMKKELHDSQTQMKQKEIEVNKLLKNNNTLQDTQLRLSMEKSAQEKIISDLKCECSKLETDLNSLKSKDSDISDMKQENNSLRKKMNKLENKLIECVCAICDNAYDKCSLMNCLFPECNMQTQSCALLRKSSDMGVQTFSEAQKNSQTPTIKETISPKEQRSSKETCQTTLPFTTNKSGACRKDVIISSMYQSTDPFAYKISNNMELHSKENVPPLKAIFEEDSDMVVEKFENIKHPSEAYASDII